MFQRFNLPGHREIRCTNLGWGPSCRSALTEPRPAKCRRGYPDEREPPSRIVASLDRKPSTCALAFRSRGTDCYGGAQHRPTQFPAGRFPSPLELARWPDYGYLGGMRFRPCLAVVVTASLAATGCKKEEIQVYRAPKDIASAGAVASGSVMPAAAPRATPDASAERPPWTVPDGWKEKPRDGTSMRIASYGVTAPDGRSVDISVVPLGPVAGSELDNVNRWRRELKLGEIGQADLGGLTASASIGTMAGKLYDMVGDQPTLDGKFKARTVAAILSTGGTTVFFKMIGEDALVTENKPKFLAWLKSVDTGDASPSSPSPTAAPAPTIPTTPPGMAGPVSPPPSTDLPQWEVPDGWKPKAATTMRLASFVVGADGDLSVVALGPAAGGTLANVNRWRSQLGLSALTDAELGAATTSVTLASGPTATVVEVTGEGQFAGRKTLAAIIARPDRTWFYKLSGESGLVTAEKERFVKFIKSVKY